MTLLSELKQIDDMHDAGTITQAQHDKMSADAVKKYQPTSNKKIKKVMGIAIIALLLALLAFSIGGSTITTYNNTTNNFTNNITNNFSLSDNTKVNKTGDEVNYTFRLYTPDNSTKIVFSNSTLLLEKYTIGAYAYLIMDGLFKTYLSAPSGVSTAIVQSPTETQLQFNNISEYIFNTSEINLSGNNITNCGNCNFISEKKLIQTVSLFSGNFSSGTGIIPQDDTYPQDTEGTEFMTVNITPKYINSTLRIYAQTHISNNNDANLASALFINNSVNAYSVAYDYQVTAQGISNQQIIFDYITSNLSTLKISIRSGAASGTTYFNGNVAGRRFNEAIKSYIIVDEYH